MSALTLHPCTANSATHAAPSVRRYLPFAAAACALHVCLLTVWSDKEAPVPLRSAKTVTVSLSQENPPPAPATPIAAPAAPAARPIVRPTVNRRTAASRMPAAPMTDNVATDHSPPVEAAEVAPVPMPMPALEQLGGPVQIAPEAPPETAAASVAASASAASAQTAGAPADTLHIAVPPSGLLKMKVVYVAPGKNPVYGLGEIQWSSQNNQYSMRVEASLDLLITSLRLYRSQSEGSISEAGIQPRMMSESRRGRSETATHFNYDQSQLTFSSSNKHQDLLPGAQDRSTVFMQLAGLGLAAPDNFRPGRQIRIQVAEDRDASVFTFIVTGLEEVETRLGKIPAWHVLRPPRPGFYNSTLELWLAPSYQWYPVQIRNTETNGAVTTQTAAEIRVPATEGN